MYKIFKIWVAVTACLLFHINFCVGQDYKFPLPGYDSVKVKIKGMYRVGKDGAADHAPAIRNVDGSGVHYGLCMNLEVQNTSRSYKEISIPGGTLLTPVDSPYQVMLVTHEVNVTASPKSTAQWAIYALCTQEHKSAPTSMSFYKVGRQARLKLRQVAQFVEDNNLQNYSGQLLCWHYTDNLRLPGDKKFSEVLQKFKQAYEHKDASQNAMQKNAVQPVEKVAPGTIEKVKIVYRDRPNEIHHTERDCRACEQSKLNGLIIILCLGALLASLILIFFTSKFWRKRRMLKPPPSVETPPQE